MVSLGVKLEDSRSHYLNSTLQRAALFIIETEEDVSETIRTRTRSLFVILFSFFWSPSIMYYSAFERIQEGSTNVNSSIRATGGDYLQ